MFVLTKGAMCSTQIPDPRVGALVGICLTKRASGSKNEVSKAAHLEILYRSYSDRKILLSGDVQLNHGPEDRNDREGE